MLLTDDQFSLLKTDLDYMLGRTTCNSLQLTRGQIATAMVRDPDVLLDLVDGLSCSDARWLSVPIGDLRPLISVRARGGSRRSAPESGPVLIEA